MSPRDERAKKRAETRKRSRPRNETTNNVSNKTKKRERSSSKLNNRRTKRTRHAPIKFSPQVTKKASEKKKEKKTTKYTKESLEKMMYSISSVFTGNKTFANKLNSINILLKDELGKKVRDVITGGSTPDTECKKARERANNLGHMSAPGIDYKHQRERENGIGAIDVEDGLRTKAKGLNSQKRQAQFSFQAEQQGFCGTCWLCGLDVHYYSGEGWLTSCGECEHIAAITASFLTGMLTSANLDIQSYNYGSAHVHCNQKKSDTISMKFTNDGLWEIWKEGTDKIINDIVDRSMHGSEYDPVFKVQFQAKLKNRQAFKNSIRTNIEGVTKEWCNVANRSITGIEKKKRLMGYKLAEKTKEVTIELMKEIKGYQKFIKGGREGKAKTQLVLSPKQNREIELIDNVQSKNNISKRQNDKLKAMTITPSLEEEVADFSNIFGVKICTLLADIHILQGSIIKKYGIDFFNNLEKAGRITPRFAELNKSLKEFIIANKNSL